MLSEVVVGAGSTRPWVELLPHGIVVETAVSHIPDKYSHVAIDKYVIMPNHVHFIMSIQGRVDPAPTLGQIVAYLKYQTAKTAETRELWQRGFYDRIIRNSDEYRRIWQYIDNNPATWREDRYYVNRADASHV
ncbi:MAG: transposase [Oscillospiraceae bacterium]|jgi:REP element-mobilizing transposase RayT|nr:transposase [Oscillospiraceae bacterium]